MTLTKATNKVSRQIQTGQSLPVMEHFYTIQGEGVHTGRAAYFIRTAGCDVGCVWCDVKESWQQEGHPVMQVSAIVKEASRHPAKIAVITGGEPTMHNLAPLCKSLKEAGFSIHLETSGAHPLTGEFDWICLSPKKFKHPLSEVYEKAHELKVVIYNNHDFKWAREQAEQVSKNCQLILQPEWSKREKMTPKIVEFVKNHPHWSISLQTHKYLGVP